MSKFSSKWFDSFFEQEVVGTGNGVTTNFNLTYQPQHNKSVLVFVGPVPQVQGVTYNITAKTIQFTTAPANGQDIFVFYIKKV